MKSLYERILDLRDRISLDGDDTIYEEDYLLLDEVLDFIGSVEQDNEIKAEKEAQEEDYNATVDIYNELEIGIKFKKQEKLLELYRKLSVIRNDLLSYCEVLDDDYDDFEYIEIDLEKKIKELENE